MSSQTEASVSWPQALGWRLERHFLDPVGSGTAADVVRRLGAVLAMDESLADLAVCARGAQAGELATALADGTVIIGFTNRGAMHYLSPEEGGMYLSVRTAGRQWELPSWVDYYHLEPAAWPSFRAAVREALGDGPMTVPELGQAVARKQAYRHLQPVFEDGAGTLIKPLSWQGDLSFGPRRDGQRTVQSLEVNPRWGGVPDLDEAGPRAVTAYVGTYGPVTWEHVDYWFGKGLSAGLKRLRSWFDGLGDALAAVDVEGTTAYVLRDDVDALLGAEQSDAVRFLPGHDQWVMGVSTKDEHVTPPALRELMTRKANPVLHGGVVCGTWTARGDQVSVDWLADGRRPAAAIKAEVERLGLSPGA